VLQQLLWAKALASQVMSFSAASSSTRKPRAMCERGNASKVAGGPRHGRPGQRGQPPSTPTTASSGATSGSTAPFARNAAARAWAALHLAAGEAPAQSAGRQEPWDSSPEDAARLAAAMAPDNEGASRLLLEIAVLVFAMGCRLGCSGKARLLALPLAQAAANRLTAAARASANCDDSARAAQKAVEVLAAVAEIAIAGGAGGLQATAQLRPSYIDFLAYLTVSSRVYRMWLKSEVCSWLERVESQLLSAHLDSQDDQDRKNIALFGYKNVENKESRTSIQGGFLPELDPKLTPRRRIAQVLHADKPTINLDKRCLSCSGSPATTLAGFKLACLQYSPSAVEYRRVSYSRAELISLRLDLLHQAQEQLKAAPG
ncbi:unnamed protein product, partial [Polarella glacialis]